jgi:hypothetical protein
MLSKNFIIVLLIEISLSNYVLAQSNLIFSGNNQTKPGLGINVGTIDYGMSQWVFTNKFKHARDWRPVSTGDNWNSYSMAGAIQTTWSSDMWPINFTMPSWAHLGYQTELGK